MEWNGMEWNGMDGVDVHIFVNSSGLEAYFRKKFEDSRPSAASGVKLFSGVGRVAR